MKSLDKFGLYCEINKIRARFGINISHYPIKIIDFIGKRMPRIRIGDQPFFTKGLHGMAVLGGDMDFIILNSHRDEYERNFDCSHEFMHTELHRDGPSVTFNCFSEARPNQDSYIEWQANEGAAEFLVPSWALLPLIKANRQCLDSYEGIYELKKALAEYFFVTPMVIEKRLESLKYEIQQHLSGIPLEFIKVLSLSQQRQRGIQIESINDVQWRLLPFDDFMDESWGQ